MSINLARNQTLKPSPQDICQLWKEDITLMFFLMRHSRDAVFKLAQVEAFLANLTVTVNEHCRY